MLQLVALDPSEWQISQWCSLGIMADVSPFPTRLSALMNARPIHTIDIETLDGWARLNLTSEQLCAAAAEIADTLIISGLISDKA